ncbi:MAG: hypothetical protein ABFD25_22700 [Clostridiaceae bacterium]
MNRPSWETPESNTGIKRPSWETSGASSFAKPSWESASQQNTIQQTTMPQNSSGIKPSNEAKSVQPEKPKTPIDQRVRIMPGNDSRSYLGMNIIPAYKEDKPIAKIGKGIVNYGLGGIASVFSNALNAIPQALMQTDVALVNAAQGRPQDFSEKTLRKDILPKSYDKALTDLAAKGPGGEFLSTGIDMLTNTALDPTTYVMGGVLDDLSRAGIYGKGAQAGTMTNLEVNAARGQKALEKSMKEAAKAAKKAGTAIPSVPQQATEEYLRAERRMNRLDGNAARNVGTNAAEAIYVSPYGTAADDISKSPLLLPEGKLPEAPKPKTDYFATSGGTVSNNMNAINTPPGSRPMLPEGNPTEAKSTGQYMIDLGRRSVGLPVYGDAKNTIEAPFTAVKSEIPQNSAAKRLSDINAKKAADIPDVDYSKNAYTRETPFTVTHDEVLKALNSEPGKNETIRRLSSEFAEKQEEAIKKLDTEIGKIERLKKIDEIFAGTDASRMSDDSLSRLEELKQLRSKLSEKQGGIPNTGNAEPSQPDILRRLNDIQKKSDEIFGNTPVRQTDTTGNTATRAAKKEAAQPQFTAYTSAGPEMTDTRAFKDTTGKTIAQSLQGDEIYDDIVKNLEGANYISDESVKAIAQGIKDKSGMTLNFKDVYRNFRDAFGRAYPYVKQKYLDPFDAAKKSYVDTVKRYTDDIYENVVKGLEIKKGSKESAAVQWFGEGQRMTGMTNAIDLQTGKKITIPNMVPYTLDDLQKEFPSSWQNIVKADNTFRSAYDELIDAVNATRRQIYPTNPEKLVPKRNDYYRHFREMQDSFEGFKNMFETPSQIDPKLAGISEFTKPKSRWASFMQKRGKGAYKADAVGGFIDYIQPASYAINIDPHVVKFRSLAKDIAEGTEKTKNANNFIKWLNDFSNSLAGKTSKYDRLIQEDIPGGRTTMRALTWLNNRVKANTVLLNARSSLAQTANIPTGIARVKDPFALGKGISDTLAGIIGKGKSAKLYAKSQFISERYAQDLISRFDQKLINQPKKFAAWFMGAFDELGTKFIWNSSYNKAVANSMENPIKYADDLTRSIVAGRGIGEVPLIQQSKLFQLAAPFQLEVANLWHVMGDMVKEKDFAGLIALFAANYLFNNTAEEITGNRVTFDPIDAIADALTEDDMNAWKMAGRLGGEVLSNVPLGQSIASVYPEYGFNLSGIEMPTRQELFGRNDPTRYGSGLLIVKGMQDPVSKLLPSFGGAQAKKTYEAVNDLVKGGDIKDGKLRYLVKNTPENAIKGTLFGKSAFNEAKEYYDKNRRDLSEKQTQQVMNSTDREGVYEAMMQKRKIEALRSKIKALKNSGMTPEEKEKKMKELQKQLENAAK